MRSSGSVIGGAINFGNNHKDGAAGGVRWSTYVVFIVFGELFRREANTVVAFFLSFFLVFFFFLFVGNKGFAFLSFFLSFFKKYIMMVFRVHLYIFRRFAQPDQESP